MVHTAVYSSISMDYLLTFLQLFQPIHPHFLEVRTLYHTQKLFSQQTLIALPATPSPPSFRMPPASFANGTWTWPCANASPAGSMATSIGNSLIWLQRLVHGISATTLFQARCGNCGSSMQRTRPFLSTSIAHGFPFQIHGPPGPFGRPFPPGFRSRLVLKA